MTNYEKYKDDIERLGDNSIAFDKSNNKIVKCVDIACNDCAFYENFDACRLNAMKWAAEEYKEPEVDWSKVPIDTPVLISGDGKEWYRRYFSGADENGQPTVFGCGATRWSSKDFDENERVWHVKHIKLAEVE